MIFWFFLLKIARVVTKDEVIDTVWEGGAISDGTLNARINAARRAVGDTGDAQGVIKTFPRKGFRFVTEGKEIEPEKVQDQTAQRHIQHNGPSLTVLPFANLSPAAENEYLADGLTEDVVTALSKLSGFFVTDRNTTFALKSGTVDPQKNR